MAEEFIKEPVREQVLGLAKNYAWFAAAAVLAASLGALKELSWPLIAALAISALILAVIAWFLFPRLQPVFGWIDRWVRRIAPAAAFVLMFLCVREWTRNDDLGRELGKRPTADQLEEAKEQAKKSGEALTRAQSDLDEANGKVEKLGARAVLGREQRRELVALEAEGNRLFDIACGWQPATPAEDSVLDRRVVGWRDSVAQILTPGDSPQPYQPARSAPTLDCWSWTLKWSWGIDHDLRDIRAFLRQRS